MATLLLSACGSSSQTAAAATSPSPNKCALEVNVDGSPFAAAGGAGLLRITTNRDCPWSAKSDGAWVTLGQPADGQGNGSVTLSVGANTDPTSRSAAVAVNDQRVEIAQAGRPCEFTMSSNHESVGATGGDLSVSVRASASACDWTAISPAPWISITSGREGHGNGTVTLHVEAFTGPPRSGSVMIAGQTVQVDQGAGCSYTINLDAYNVDAGGGERQVAVNTSAGCAWTAQAQAPWITIVSGASGNGAGAVAFRVAATDGPGRTGTLTVAGRSVAVAQAGGCTSSITPSTVSAGAQGTNATVQVAAAAGCAWTAQSQAPWITIVNGASGNGAGAVVFRVAASDGPERTGTLSVAGRNVTVTQSAGCTYSIAPSTVNAAAQGANATVQVEAAGGCAWSASSGSSWVTIASGATGTGRGSVQLSIAGNTGPARTASIAIAGQSLTIAQASGCTYAIAPSSQDVRGEGGNPVVSVTTAAGCSWTANSSVDWVTVATPSGAGPGQSTFVVKPNASPPRTVSVTVAGQTVTINQASLCTWVFAPPSHELPAAGGNGNVLVIVSGACSWTAVPNVPWIQITAITGGDSPVGNGLLQFVVPVNTGASRTGLIKIGGVDYVVHQAGAR